MSFAARGMGRFQPWRPSLQCSCAVTVPVVADQISNKASIGDGRGKVKINVGLEDREREEKNKAGTCSPSAFMVCYGYKLLWEVGLWELI